MKTIKTKELYESPMKDRNEERYGVDSDSCVCCNKPTDENTRFYVHMGTDWEAYNVDDVELVEGRHVIKGTNQESQGFWPIGTSCARKMGKTFTFKESK